MTSFTFSITWNAHQPCQQIDNISNHDHLSTGILASYYIYNHVLNILRLFDGGADFPVTAKNKEWLLVINWYVQVALPVAERLKTEHLRNLRNNRKFSKLYRIVA